jgi:hypothetical protein
MAGVLGVVSGCSVAACIQRYRPNKDRIESACTGLGWPGADLGRMQPQITTAVHECAKAARPGRPPRGAGPAGLITFRTAH